MRALVVSPGFPVADRPYYTPIIVDTMAALAQRHDLEVHAISNATGFGLLSYRGIDVIRYGARSRAQRALELALIATKRNRARAFDVVWSLWVDRTGAAALAIAKLIGAPAVLSIMGGELADLPDVDYGYSRTRSRRATLSALLAGARTITVGSARLREMLPEGLRARARVAPFGVDVERIARRDRAPWSFGQVLRLVVVSDLSPVKRVSLAIAALGALVARGIDARLEIFGSSRPQELERARAAAEPNADRVRFRGFVPSEQLRAVLAEFDVLVHPSAHESQGAALIEAALAGLPIACFDVGVAGELKALGAAVELAGEPGALADAVLRAAQRPAGPASAIAAEYSVSAAADRWERVLLEASA